MLLTPHSTLWAILNITLNYTLVFSKTPHLFSTRSTNDNHILIVALQRRAFTAGMLECDDLGPGGYLFFVLIDFILHRRSLWSK